jgi:hypothetical protein
MVQEPPSVQPISGWGAILPRAPQDAGSAQDAVKSRNGQKLDRCRAWTSPVATHVPRRRLLTPPTTSTTIDRPNKTITTTVNHMWWPRTKIRMIVVRTNPASNSHHERDRPLSRIKRVWPLTFSGQSCDPRDPSGNPSSSAEVSSRWMLPAEGSQADEACVSDGIPDATGRPLGRVRCL